MKPPQPSKDLKDAVSDLKYLLEPGLLGHYMWFEAVEVIAFDSANNSDVVTPRNIFSIYIAEQGDMPPEPEDKFLSKAKQLSGLKGWRFRVTRRPVRIAALLACLDRYSQDGIWAPPGQLPLAVGDLAASPPWFCPPDASTEVPLNGVLKNNFWSGSHVLELKDHAKSTLRELLGKEAVWEELSAWLSTLLPLDLARVPDRIGDVLLQVPANTLLAKFKRNPGAPMQLRVAWNPQVTPRPVTVECRVEQEGLISLQRAVLPVGHLEWPTPSAAGDLRFSVYDIEKGLLLAATPAFYAHGRPPSFASHSSTLIAPRRFRVQGPDRQFVTQEVGLWQPAGGRHSAQVGLPKQIDWLARRELRAKMNQLVKSRRFLQYGLGQAAQVAEQARALNDIRELIRTANQGAVYLWDPYLSANDILNTLAFCTDTATELRALTSARPAEPQKSTSSCPRCVAEIVRDDETDVGGTSRQKWIAAQQQVLDTAFLEPPRMRLEFRMSSSDHGGFHDRFLIFPALGGTRSRVWSLGASINHIGAQHCIVQEVAYPEPVLEAFIGFWDRSPSNSHYNSLWRAATGR